MSEPFLGELRIMPYANNFVTRNWLPCNGQIIPIQQNTALFSLLGTQYGGNGQTTFALPDLRGRSAVGAGQGPGLTSYQQGATAGTETVTLNATQIPPHSHDAGTAQVKVGGGATTGAPAGAYFGTIPNSDSFGNSPAGNMAANMVNGQTTAIGGGQPHDNHQPYLTLGYFIAIQGVFPSRG